MTFILLLITSKIPSIDTGSEVLRLIFKRGDTYDTTYIALENLTYYIIMNTLDFIYVNICNMNYSRKSILFSNHENRKDFFKTIAFSPIFYFLGNNVAMRSPHDLSGLKGVEYDYWDCVTYNVGIWTSAYILGL